MDHLFALTDVPPHHRRNAAASGAEWYTWAPSMLAAVGEVRDEIAALRAPRRISVRGCAPYAVTYSYRKSELSPRLLSFAAWSASALLETRVDRRLRFFTGLLDRPMTSSAFHKCLALVRLGLVQLTGDPRTALHAPVKTEQDDDGFPLHADLFLTERLWLIFDRVPDDQSGKTLLLASDAFHDLLRSQAQVPRPARRKIHKLLERRAAQDSFDEFFRLVHAEENPWSKSLARVLKAHAIAIKFRRGEGYLLHDGHWLHGRTAVRGVVTAARFRRLVYGPIAAS